MSERESIDPFENCVAESKTYKVTEEQYNHMKALFDNHDNGKNRAFLELLPDVAEEHNIRIRNYVGTVVFGKDEFVEIVPKTADVKDAGSIQSAKMNAAEMFRICGGINGRFSNQKGGDPYLFKAATDVFISIVHRLGVNLSVWTINHIPVKEIIRSKYPNLEKLLCDTLYCPLASECEMKVSVTNEEWLSDKFKVEREFCEEYLCSLLNPEDSNENPSFLFRMERLYELCMWKIIHDRFGQYGVFAQFSIGHLFQMGSYRNILLKPDIVIGTPAKLILDTKWKVIGQSGDIATDDIYQTLAYSVRANAPVVLLYPGPEPSDFREEVMVCGPGKVLVRFINIGKIEESVGNIMNGLLDDLGMASMSTHPSSSGNHAPTQTKLQQFY